MVNRRLVVGSIITEADDLTPFTVNDRVDGGFIKLKVDEVEAADPADPVAPPKPAARAPRPDKPADAE
jgi:hypothetical protein